MKNYISVNLVSQSLLMIRCIQKNHCYSISGIEQLKFPYGVNLTVSMDFAKQCEWVKEKNSVIELTQIGNTVASMFDGEMISGELWKTILNGYISVCHPAWAKRIPYGRKEAFLFMNEEEQRCFFEAGLIDSQNDDVLKWWDSIAEIERMKKNNSLEEVGRKGERLTMKYEELRTGVKPDWRSVETNLSGYDIISQRSADDTGRVLIEVKTSSKPIEEAEAIISRHEWNVAKMQNNEKRYFFYIWNIRPMQIQLAVVGVDEMGHHIPDNNELGKWESVSIPFKAFLKGFRTVTETLLISSY